MYAPGLVGLAFALLVLLFMKDNPERFGHAPVQTPKSNQPAKTKGNPWPLTQPLISQNLLRLFLMIKLQCTPGI